MLIACIEFTDCFYLHLVPFEPLTTTRMDTIRFLRSILSRPSERVDGSHKCGARMGQTLRRGSFVSVAGFTRMFLDPLKLVVQMLQVSPKNAPGAGAGDNDTRKRLQREREAA